MSHSLQWYETNISVGPFQSCPRTQFTSFCCSLSPQKSFIGASQCLPLPTPFVMMRRPRHFIYSHNFQKSYSSKFGSPTSRAAFAILRDTMLVPRTEKEHRGELSRDSRQILCCSLPTKPIFFELLCGNMGLLFIRKVKETKVMT
jgi:hypothetical protein